MSRLVNRHSFLFQAEDGIRDLVRSRGLGDVYKRQTYDRTVLINAAEIAPNVTWGTSPEDVVPITGVVPCLLYTSDAADERSSVDLGGRRIIKKKNKVAWRRQIEYKST